MKKGYLIFLIILIGIILVTGYLLKSSQKEVIESSLLKKIKSEGKIIIGTDATYPPMESLNEKGEFVGIDIEIGKEIAKDLGVKAEFQNIPWEKIFDSLLEGKVDILISSITITPERAKMMAFSDPYFNAGQVIVGKVEKAELIKSLEDLRDKKIGVQKETTSEAEAKNYTDLVIPFDNYDLAIEALLKDEIDFIIVDSPVALNLISKNENLKIIGEPLTKEFYGIATRIKEKALLDQINKTLRRLKEEKKLEKFQKEWSF